MAEQPEKKDQLTPEEIQQPNPGFLERLLGPYLNRYAQKYADEATRKYAMLPDGRVDEEMAVYIRKKLAQSQAINTNYVLGPGSWVITLAAAARGFGEAMTNRRKEGGYTGDQSTGKFWKTQSIIMGGALAIDVFRMRNHFKRGLEGELKGALQAMKEERYSMRIAAERDARPQDFVR